MTQLSLFRACRWLIFAGTLICPDALLAQGGKGGIEGGASQFGESYIVAYLDFLDPFDTTDPFEDLYFANAQDTDLVISFSCRGTRV